ncbi:hypothetical protein JCM8097_001913 [Rhodosporidiobolus ruineniae]
MANTDTKRSQLLDEIAHLEAELARQSAPSADEHRSTRGTGQGGTKRERAPAAGGEWESAGGGTARRAEQQILHNVELSGIEITSSGSEVTQQSATSIRRLHSLSGRVSSSPSPIALQIRLYVREPPNSPDASDEAAKRDPGLEYLVETVECEVKGGGAELREGLKSLNLDRHTNPPAFFALLRQYSLLASSRVALFQSLRRSFAQLVKDGTPEELVKATELTFVGSSSGPSLTLSYTLTPSTGPTVLRLARPLTPTLTLFASTPSALPSSARTALQAVPEQFERMLREGVEPVKAVEAIVQALFGLMDR